jgi:hypothetical protein
VGAARTGLGCGHRIKPLNQIGIERGSEADRLRKAGRLRSGDTMQTFFVKEKRNT